MQWIQPVGRGDAQELGRWSAAVGRPVLQQTSRLSESPALEQLTVVTWNVHGTHGRIVDFVERLSSGRLTQLPPTHYVLILQEAFRHDPEIPRFVRGMRKAIRTPGTDPSVPDIEEIAARLDLSLAYVPSMRNGNGPEDRGSAMLSTLPFVDVHALELPFRRERRVVVAASVRVEVSGSSELVRFINLHFDPWASWRRLYVLGNPRPDQARSVLTHLHGTLAARHMVVGGDLNTFWPGETATRTMLGHWGTSQGVDDPTPTRGRSRIDRLFFKFASTHVGDTRVVRNTFGSDHRPVIGTLKP